MKTLRSFLLWLMVSLSITTPVSAELFSNNVQGFTPSFDTSPNQFVPVDEAFPFNFFQDNDRVRLEWQVKEEYYLYQERISVTANGAEIGAIEMRDGQPYKDEFFGDVRIYTTPLTVTVPLISATKDALLEVRYQGCAKAGFCYPPEIRTVPISAFTSTGGSDTPTASAPKAQERSTITQSQESGFADKLANSWWTPLLFFALGVGLAFTPCVLPMYPILTSIVLGGGQITQKRALGLSFVYVQGMALTYTLLGLVVASAGLQFQAAMQHHYVLIGLSVLFIALAASMFGVYTLQLPSGVQTWLNNLSNKQQGGSNAGVFAMGAISGLVCSPCTTAPLSGALLYVAQSGDLLTGGVALYALALGMGVPLIAVAVFGNKLLPKAGGWMDRVKVMFGFILLAAPIFLLERILPELWTQIMWSVLGLSAFGWLYHAKNSLPFGGWKQSLVGIVAVLGLVASAQPIISQWWNPSAVAQAEPTVAFKRIKNLADLESELAAAKQAGKPVMLDFYADWCVACKEFEKYTFHAPEVEAKLQGYVLLQADVTRSMPEDIELLQKLEVLGLPTIEFWDANGEYIPNARLTGFMPAEPFLAHLNAL
ncbi:Thiol:disulfide interchange protein dsbD [Vibrio nigripulchritudo SOn1]|uniref:Thiol:disulfide interchange protein DsbD n=1 Tax=Vibrio nigripulchritudo SOn1 TaxID=1238450 RepID=A0AAV2VSX3_9VIBR|nr:protein-disulfide reductase DsbD [Vibrio nigripulchritudo]CCO47824.1 Thiol:disulfide interchange protein dsbD [Vibrio nigripulchritudo SOn1]